METTHTIFPGGAEKSLERQNRAFHWVRQLCAGPGRLAGRPGEAESAARVEGWLRELGFEEIETRSCTAAPGPGWVLALHLGLGALGCVWGGVAGAALATAAAWSFRRGLLHGPAPLARWLPRPRARSVLARAGAPRPRRRVVLTAPLCTGQAGALFAERTRETARHRLGLDDRPARWSGSLPAHALAAAALVAAASALGADGPLAVAVRVGLGGALAAGAALAIQWARSPASPGANAHASGVAALLTAAEQLAAQLPPDVELWCAALGGGECGEPGLEALLDAHPEWLGDATAFVHFAAVGGGTLHYVRSEGALAREPHRPMLQELARRVAASGVFAEVTAVELGGETGARPIARRGGQVLSLIALDETGAPRHQRQADDLPEHLDMEGVVRAADFGCSVVSAHWRGDAEPLAYV